MEKVVERITQFFGQILDENGNWITVSPETSDAPEQVGDQFKILGYDKGNYAKRIIRCVMTRELTVEKEIP